MAYPTLVSRAVSLEPGHSILEARALAWLSLLVELRSGFGYRDALDVLAPALGARLHIRDDVSLELSALVPLSGDERLTVAGALSLWIADF